MARPKEPGKRGRDSIDDGPRDRHFRRDNALPRSWNLGDETMGIRVTIDGERIIVTCTDMALLLGHRDDLAKELEAVVSAYLPDGKRKMDWIE